MTSGPTASTRIDELHAAHANSIFRFLLKLTRGDRQTAEDLLQETMLRAWRNVDTLPVQDVNQRRWLFAVAKRIFIDTIRSRHIRPTETPVIDLDWIGRAEDTTEAALANDSMVHAFGRLSEAHRKVLADLHFLGLPVEEVAERMRVPVGTVKSRAHYALRALRNGMQETE